MVCLDVTAEGEHLLEKPSVRAWYTAEGGQDKGTVTETRMKGG